MSFSLQKASFWKRISAYMIDTVLMIFLALAFSLVTHTIFKVDERIEKVDAFKTQYAQDYGVDLELAQKDPSTVTKEEKADYDENYKKFEEMNKAIAKDKKAQEANADFLSSLLASFAISLFFSNLALNFGAPLLFKYGRTIGKRVFGLAVIRSNGVKISSPVLFVRAVVGLYAMETMFPIIILMMIWFGMLGIIGTIILVGFGILQIVCLIRSQVNQSIHDLLTDSVVVDMASQTIYETNEELIAAQKAAAAEKAAAEEYAPVRVTTTAPQQTDNQLLDKNQEID